MPNVLLAYSAHGAKLRNMANFYNELMLGESPLSKLEREMIAVVVSSANRSTTARQPTARQCASCQATRRSANCW